MILPMKKATIFALRSDREALLLALQRSSILMVTESDGCVRDESADATASEVQSTKDVISFMSRYREKSGFFDDAPSVDFSELIAEKNESRKLTAKAAEIESSMAALNTEISSARSALEQYEPWLGLDIRLNELSDTKDARVHTGYIPRNRLEEFKTACEEKGWCSVFGMASGSYACMYVCFKDDDEQLASDLKAMGFIESAPPSGELTAAQERERILAKIDENNTKLAALSGQAKELGTQVEKIELLYDKLTTDLSRQSTPFMQTDSTFFVQGWLTAEREKDLEETIRDATDIYELVIEDPAEDEKPPTQTRNNKFVRPFETFTDMFSRPNPREGIDPNPAMAPWYWIIFGMMMADAGYGLVMLVLTWLFLKLKKPKGEMRKLVTVFMYSSIPTIFWGVMFGSYFGAEWFKPVVFAPLYNPIPVMVICFVLGALHMFCGMGIHAARLIKAGQWQEALGNHISWIFLITGIGLIFVPALNTVAMVVCGIGLLLVLAFSKNDTKNPFKRVFGGITSLYGVTGYMSDILSYSRILALMLSSGVVGMVMNMLAGMVQGSVIGFVFSILIYIAGHAFNLVMGLLSAYVHTSRLQYIEFFGKFYEGGGYAFVPLSVKSSYTVVTDKK